MFSVCACATVVRRAVAGKRKGLRCRRADSGLPSGVSGQSPGLGVGWLAFASSAFASVVHCDTDLASADVLYHSSGIGGLLAFEQRPIVTLAD